MVANIGKLSLALQERYTKPNLLVYSGKMNHFLSRLHTVGINYDTEFSVCLTLGGKKVLKLQ